MATRPYCSNEIREYWKGGKLLYWTFTEGEQTKEKCQVCDKELKHGGLVESYPMKQDVFFCKKHGLVEMKEQILQFQRLTKNLDEMDD